MKHHLPIALATKIGMMSHVSQSHDPNAPAERHDLKNDRNRFRLLWEKWIIRSAYWIDRATDTMQDTTAKLMALFECIGSQRLVGNRNAMKDWNALNRTENNELQCELGLRWKNCLSNGLATFLDYSDGSEVSWGIDMSTVIEIDRINWVNWMTTDDSNCTECDWASSGRQSNWRNVFVGFSMDQIFTWTDLDLRDVLSFRKARWI